jgi:dTDP-4-amino-4,6-dideoxy-D-glucose acyltransferase
VLSAKKIRLGSCTHIGAHAVLCGQGEIEIRDFASVSHGVMLFSSTDDLSVPALTNVSVPLELQKIITGNILLDKHAVVGAGSVLMPNIILGFACVVGVLSYLPRPFEYYERPYTIVAGIPAKFIRERARPISAEALAELEARAMSL